MLEERLDVHFRGTCTAKIYTNIKHPTDPAQGSCSLNVLYKHLKKTVALNR